MTKNWILRAGLAAAVAGLAVVAGCHKKQAQSPASPSSSQSTPATTPPPSSSQPNTPSAANDRTPTDEGDLKGGENVEGAPAVMSEDAFLAEYKKLPGVVVRPSGLMYRIIQSGPASGKSPKVTDKVKVEYKGSLMDGTVFDQTPQGQPASFGISDTIKGWQEALPLMKVGDAWEIVIPSPMAYGDKGAAANGQTVIPPNTPLVFEIHLVEINPK